jgi:hypothetical protein
VFAYAQAEGVEAQPPRLPQHRACSGRCPDNDGGCPRPAPSPGRGYRGCRPAAGPSRARWRASSTSQPVRAPNADAAAGTHRAVPAHRADRLIGQLRAGRPCPSAAGYCPADWVFAQKRSRGNRGELEPTELSEAIKAVRGGLAAAHPCLWARCSRSCA